jgi:hypothetical protein
MMFIRVPYDLSIFFFQDVSDGLRRLQLFPKVKISQEEWQDMTNNGALTSNNDTLSAQQFFEVCVCV